MSECTQSQLQDYIDAGVLTQDWDPDTRTFGPTYAVVCHEKWIDYWMDCKWDDSIWPHALWYFIGSVHQDYMCGECPVWCADLKCCGGACGECDAGDTCVDGLCSTCQPACDGKDCGDDGCGGQCGKCGVKGQYFTVCEDGTCQTIECDKDEHKGCCDGDLSYYCSNGKIKQQDCSNYGKTCGWHKSKAQYTCVDEGGEDPPPVCPWKCPLLCEDAECGVAGPIGECDCGGCLSGQLCQEGECLPECPILCGEAQCGNAGADGECDFGSCPGESVCHNGKCVTSICLNWCGDKECGLYKSIFLFMAAN